MPVVELLTVTDTFWINQNGTQMLILHPNFSVPDGWSQQGWSKRTESVVVARPDGQHIQATAQISMTHLNIPDPAVPIDERWRITVWLTDRTKDEVPVGSQVLVLQEVRDAILPRNLD